MCRGILQFLRPEVRFFIILFLSCLPTIYIHTDSELHQSHNVCSYQRSGRSISDLGFIIQHGGQLAYKISNYVVQNCRQRDLHATFFLRQQISTDSKFHYHFYWDTNTDDYDKQNSFVKDCHARRNINQSIITMSFWKQFTNNCIFEVSCSKD